MRSIVKSTQEEKEVRLLINSIKNTLTDIPYNFMYDKDDDDIDEDSWEDEKYE